MHIYIILRPLRKTSWCHDVMTPVVGEVQPRRGTVHLPHHIGQLTIASIVLNKAVVLHADYFDQYENLFIFSVQHIPSKWLITIYLHIDIDMYIHNIYIILYINI